MKKILFYFVVVVVGKITCQYANENNPAEREEIMIKGEWGKISGTMSLSSWGNRIRYTSAQ